MPLRIAVSAALALLTLIAFAGVSYAAENSDLEEVAIGTFLVALGLMAFLLIVYLIKHAAGLDKPPPEAESGDSHH